MLHNELVSNRSSWRFNAFHKRSFCYIFCMQIAPMFHSKCYCERLIKKQSFPLSCRLYTWLHFMVRNSLVQGKVMSFYKQYPINYYLLWRGFFTNAPRRIFVPREMRLVPKIFSRLSGLPLEADMLKDVKSSVILGERLYYHDWEPIVKWKVGTVKLCT